MRGMPVRRPSEPEGDGDRGRPLPSPKSPMYYYTNHCQEVTTTLETTASRSIVPDDLQPAGIDRPH